MLDPKLNRLLQSASPALQRLSRCTVDQIDADPKPKLSSLLDRRNYLFLAVDSVQNVQHLLIK